MIDDIWDREKRYRRMSRNHRLLFTFSIFGIYNFSNITLFFDSYRKFREFREFLISRLLIILIEI